MITALPKRRRDGPTRREISSHTSRRVYRERPKSPWSMLVMYAQNSSRTLLSCTTVGWNIRRRETAARGSRTTTSVWEIDAPEDVTFAVIQARSSCCETGTTYSFCGTAGGAPSSTRAKGDGSTGMAADPSEPLHRRAEPLRSTTAVSAYVPTAGTFQARVTVGGLPERSAWSGDERTPQREMVRVTA